MKQAMNTDDLIRGLTADLTVSRTSLERLFCYALLPGLFVALVLFAAILGPRPDFVAMMGDVRFMFKFVVTLSLGACSALLVWRLVRPGAPTHMRAAALGLVVLVLVAGVAVELATVPRSLWGAKLVGQNSVVVFAILALRRGAPERPVLAGSVAGLFAGAIGAAIYAAHCPDDSPLFVACWYGLAIAGVTAVGGIAGRLSLRW